MSERTPRKRWPRLPLVAVLMQQPFAARLLAVLLATHLGLMLAGFSGWRCPLFAAFERPCPGCGLSRSILELGGGHLARSVELHAFGPMAALALAVFVVSGFLPRTGRERLIHGVERFEVATGFSHLCLALFFIYWLVRLVAGQGTISSLA